jgi:putative transposon-encoded protein
MRKISIENEKFHLQDDIEEVAEGEVKKIGNGGMIMSSKKFVGRKVYVLIRKEE